MATREQILELPKKYAIGKRPLSRVLGWGELTYTRLIDGAKPSPQHSEELLRALNEPLTYSLLLEQAHASGAVTGTTYERSRKAVDKLLKNDKGVDEARKLHAVARRFCILAKGDITPHALGILMYYAQGYSMAMLDEPLFAELPVAANDGPAYPTVSAWYTFDRIAEIGSGEDAGDQAGDDPQAKCDLSRKEDDLVKTIFAEYGVYSGTKLAELACAESPWKKARKRAERDNEALETAPISAKTLGKFFSKALGKK